MDLNLDRICTVRKNLRNLYTAMSLILFVILCGTLLVVDASDQKCTLIKHNYKSSLAYVCIEADISNLEELPSTVEWIEFSVSRFRSISADTFGRFSRLEKLTFYNCDIRDIDPDAFRGLNNLELLVIYNSNIGVVRASLFEHLPNLRRLVLERNKIVYVVPEAFSGLTKLTTLSLHDNDLNCLPIDLLSDLPSLKNVRIGRNPWLCSCREDLELFFERRGINVGYKEHSTGYRNECMTEVKLENRGIFFPVNQPEPGTVLTSSGDVGNSFSFLSGLQDDIRWISASAVSIKRIPAYTFFRFGNSLRSLEFRNCNITDIEAGAFAGLAKLKRLVLVGNHFNVIEATWFYDLVNLQNLILDSNNIVRIENRAFLPLGKLRNLSLNSNKLQCLSIDELHNLVKLKRLNVASNTWDCKCQANLTNYLMSHRIAYEINDFHCHSPLLETNEIEKSSKITKRHQICEIHKETVRNTTAVFRNVSVTQTRTGAQMLQEIPRLDFDDEVLVGKDCCTSCHRVDIHGFMFAYACDNTSLDQTSEIPSSIDALEFSSSRIKTIRRSSLARFGQSLKMLKLWNCQTELIEPHAFVDLVALETLIISNGNLEIVRASWFHRLQNLRHLDLTGNKIRRIEDGVFGLIPYLVTLEISDNRMTCISLDLLDSLRDLKFMRIAGNPWTCVCRLRLVQYLEERRISYERDMFQNDIGVNESTCYYSTTAATPSVTVGPPSPGYDLTAYSPPNYCEGVSREGKCTYEVGVEPGQIIKYKCTYGNLFVLDQIAANAESIELDEVCIGNLPPRAFSKFPNLTKLVIRNCRLQGVEPRAFDGLYKLQELTIHNSHLEIIDSSWFRDTSLNLSNLTTLSLTGNKITRIEDGVFPLLPNLVTLDIDNNGMTCISFDLLDSLGHLKFMRIAGNPWTCLCRLRLVQFLEERGISYEKDTFQNDIDADESQCLSTTTVAAPTVRPRPHFPGCNKTMDPASEHCLKVSREGECTYEEVLQPNQIKYKCSYGNLTVLQKISSNAESIELDDVCIHSLPPRAFSKFHNLTKLVIRNCKLHEVEPGAFDGLFKLQELTIHNNHLEIIDSSWFRDMTQLRNLALTNNSLIEIPVDIFTHRVRSLEHLSLQGNNLTCVYTNMLTNLKLLKSMEFGDNKLKWRCRAELADYLELCNVTYTKMRNPHNSKILVRDLFAQKPEAQELSSADVTSSLKFLAIGLIFLVQWF